MPESYCIRPCLTPFPIFSTEKNKTSRCPPEARAHAELLIEGYQSLSVCLGGSAIRRSVRSYDNYNIERRFEDDGTSSYGIGSGSPEFTTTRIVLRLRIKGSPSRAFPTHFTPFFFQFFSLAPALAFP